MCRHLQNIAMMLLDRPQKFRSRCREARGYREAIVPLWHRRSSVAQRKRRLECTDSDHQGAVDDIEEGEGTARMK